MILTEQKKLEMFNEYLDKNTAEKTKGFMDGVNAASVFLSKEYAGFTAERFETSVFITNETNAIDVDFEHDLTNGEYKNAEIYGKCVDSIKMNEELRNDIHAHLTDASVLMSENLAK